MPRRKTDWLPFLTECARARRLILLEYLKAGEAACSRRLVEPYVLQEYDDNLMVQCWQLDPAIHDPLKWRNFRLDRVKNMADGGATFEPRARITICDGDVGEWSMESEPDLLETPTMRYRRFVESAMLDGRLNQGELNEALRIRAPISREQARAVHAMVLRDVLSEVLKDEQISNAEVEYLARVRAFLKQLGWAP
jgi:predicted DNA-binding transcriptional regulator YafY